MNINTNKICKNCAHNDVCKFKDEFNITLKSAYKELTKIIKNYDHLSIKIDCKHRYMINSFNSCVQALSKIGKQGEENTGNIKLSFHSIL